MESSGEGETFFRWILIRKDFWLAKNNREIWLGARGGDFPIICLAGTSLGRRNHETRKKLDGWTMLVSFRN